MDGEKRAADNAADANGAAGEPNIGELLRMITGGESAPQSGKSAPQSASLLSGLLSDPELLAKLPSIISMLTPMMSALSGSPTDGAASTKKESTLQSEDQKHGGAESERVGRESLEAVAASSVGGAPRSREQSEAAERRARLLYAIKPYLSKDRQNAIDYMIKLSRLGDILKSL